MPTLSIKNVPEEVVEVLRARAEANHRSLQGELMSIICRATEDGRWSYERSGRGEKHSGWKTVEQIMAEQRARWPEPIAEGPFAVDIIRQDRDSR